MLCILGVLMCEKDVCLTWEVMNNNLMLTCTVPDLLYRISIDDPSGITIAQCIPALTCLTSEVKGLDSPQLRSKLAVTLPINDNDTNKWTGLWTCRHGSSGKFAAIAVPMNINEQTGTCYILKSSSQFKIALRCFFQSKT